MLTSSEAQLFVADIGATCAFYVEKLGFTVGFVYGDPPFYGQLIRDRARLNVRVVGEAVFAGDIREREQLLSASITVATHEDIETLFERFRAAGVDFQRTLATEPWGATNFTVRDPDGNLVLFSGPSG